MQRCLPQPLHLGADTSKSVAALMLGDSVSSLAADEAGKYGIADVKVVEDAALTTFSPDAYATVIAEAIHTNRRRDCVDGCNVYGQRCDGACSAQIPERRPRPGLHRHACGENGNVLFKRPMYAGKAHAEVRV